jgi:trans-aconitate 2-methyltransferase
VTDPRHDWNSTVYHRLSEPQFEWGRRLVDSIVLDGPALVLDVGCGTGRVTEKLIERLPAARVVAVDSSNAMITAARRSLSGPGRRVGCVQADGAALPFQGAVDLIFSTAAFHWIKDHERLFRSLYAALKTPGRLMAQCGGGPNLARFRGDCVFVMGLPPFEPWFTGWTEPCEFADAETTARRLRQAGFVDVATRVFPSPVVLPDAAEYREFIEHVTCGPYLIRLPTADLRGRFLDALVARAARAEPPFSLDYWRLNLSAEKP